MSIGLPGSQLSSALMGLARLERGLLILADGRSENAISRRLYRRKDGTSIWIEGVHRLIRDETGKPSGYIASLRDITARVAVEEELREETALLNQTLENMDQGLLMIDASDVVRIFNRRASVLLDLPEALLAERPTLSEVFAYQEEDGEFLRTPASMLAELRSRLAQRSHRVYERERPNGTILERDGIRLILAGLSDCSVREAGHPVRNLGTLI